MWELDRKEGWASKNWCFFFFNSFIYFNWRLSTLQYCSGFCHTLTWISQIDTFWAVVLEKSPLDSKETKPVNPKWNESWIFIGRTDAEAEAPIVWPPDAKSWLIGKDPDGWERLKAGGDGDNRGWDCWMASPTQWAWIEPTPGDSEGQGSLACCSPWGRKESDTTWRLNMTWHEWASQVVLVAKNCLPMQDTEEMWLWSLGQEDPLEKEMAIHSSTIVWKIPWTEEPGRLQPMRSQRVGPD